MYNGGSFGLATYQAMIFADAGGSPGPLVATFDTQPTLPEGASYTLVNFADVGISLDANTSYWFGVRNLTGQAIGVRTTYSDSETSGFGWTIDDNDVEYTTNLGASWTDSSGLYAGRVLRFAIEGATVPTPGTLALVGLGGLVIVRRRR